MANWQMVLDVSDFWDKYPEELRLHELAGKLIERLNKLRPEVESGFPEWLYEFDNCMEDFEIFAEDDTMDYEIEEFDYRLSNLYDWADTSLDSEFGGRKLCWIKSF